MCYISTFQIWAKSSCFGILNPYTSNTDFSLSISCFIICSVSQASSLSFPSFLWCNPACSLPWQFCLWSVSRISLLSMTLAICLDKSIPSVLPAAPISQLVFRCMMDSKQGGPEGKSQHHLSNLTELIPPASEPPTVLSAWKQSPNIFLWNRRPFTTSLMK